MVLQNLHSFHKFTNMQNRFSLLLLLACVLLSGIQAGCSRSARNENNAPVVHALFDLSHAFSFYTDGRFATQYLKGERSVMNWGNFYDLDLSNTNLVVLLGCDDRSPYTDKDRETIREYAGEKGGLVILGNTTEKSQGELAEMFGVRFAGTATPPLTSRKYASGELKAQGRTAYLSLEKPEKWQVLATDKEQRPVLVVSSEGNILIGARSLAGSNPNASDSINMALWNPLLKKIASGKKIDPKKELKAKHWAQIDHREEKNGLQISYTDYLAPYAGSMFDISARCMPVIEKRMGVPLSGNMGSKIILLATDGGGFSSGETIALAVWWGGFPDKEDSMIEFITHESVHSWVLPFPEIWNEPIATYVGNLVMMDMGHKEEAEKRIAATIERARRSDPDFTLYDIEGKSNKKEVAPLEQNKVNDLHWGKTYWIWEQLRKQNPTIVADYFRAKRKHATPDIVKKYDANNTAAIMSIAMKKDLFPWFRSIGFDVDRQKADVKF